MKGNLVVYKASAGSGKTYTLATEYIAHLLSGEPDAYRHILAVTFTNKATAEMKERILQFLWELCHHRPQGLTEAVKKTAPGLNDDEIARRAASALAAIVHNYDFFRVETIDAFFQRLLANLAHELGLSAGFRVSINDGEVIEKAVGRMLRNVEQNPPVLSWVLKYVGERIADNKKWDIEKDVKLLARNLLREQLLKHDREIEAFFGCSERIEKYQTQLKDMALEASDYAANAAEQLDDEIGATPGGYEAFSRGSTLQAFLKNIVTGELKPPGRLIEGYLADAKNWLRKKDLGDCSLAARTERFRELLLEVEKLRGCAERIVNSCQLSCQHLKPMRLLGEIAKEMAAINKENNHFMLAKTPFLFDRLIGESDTSFVLEKAGINFRSVMIDEFQDTSSLQWKNFKKLLIENLAAGNKCLLVGDVKQGIYRFRGGDWSILSNISSAFRNATPEVRTLATNYRSAQAIVDFNNSLFPLAAEYLDHISEGTEIGRIYSDVHQEANCNAGGYVRICLTQTGQETEENKEALSPEEEMGKEIQRLHKGGIPYKKMAILVRYNYQCKEILNTFAQQFPGIPLVSDEAYMLASSEAIQMLIDALRYLNDPADLIARAHLALCYNKDILGKGRDWGSFTDGSLSSLPEALADTDALSKLPLTELCHRLVEILSLNTLPGSTPFLCYFFDRVMEFLEDHSARIPLFLKYWEESLISKSIPATESNGVSILTIHKSKGLAFHTVLIPRCDWFIEHDRQTDLLWCEPPQAPYNQVPLLPISSYQKAVQQSIYTPQYNSEHHSQRIENLNLLYVAFTRAKQNLLVWGEATANEKKRNMATLLYSCLEKEISNKEDGHLLYEVGTPGLGAQESEEQSDTKVETENILSNPLKINPEGQEGTFITGKYRGRFRQSNESQKLCYSPHTEEEGKNHKRATNTSTYIDRGKLMHALFAEIHTLEDIDIAIEKLAANGAIDHQEEGAKLKTYVLQQMEKAGTTEWFNPKWRIWREQTLLIPRGKDANGQHERPERLRPDRVMSDGKRYVVVDYKFGKPHAEYTKQVRKYTEQLQKMTPLPVEGYLWYVDSGKVEKV